MIQIPRGKILRSVKRVMRICAWVALGCLILITVNVYFRPLLSATAIMPNGSVVYRPFEIRQFRGEHSLYAKDGKTLLAKNIEFICFNDHYVDVISYDQGGGGIFGAQAKLDSPNLDYYDELAISGLGGNRKSCNGYYTGMIGPGMFFEGNEWPFLPPCEWQNFENLSLRDRSWFDRPCADNLPPRYYSSNPATAR